MTVGPGKYDDLCTDALHRSNADAAVLIILGGAKGSGFSLTVDMRRASNAEVLTKLPAMLRDMADQIESDQTPAGSA